MKSYAPTGFRRPLPPDHLRRCRPPNSPYSEHSKFGRRPDFPANSPGCRSSPNCGNFIVELVADNRSVERSSVGVLIAECKSKPEGFRVLQSGLVAGVLFFKQWVEALEAIVGFWESRLAGDHKFTPNLKSELNLPSDIDELNERLRTLFSDRVKRLMEGDEVKNLQKKIDRVRVEIDRISYRLRNDKRFANFFELGEKKKGLMSEQSLLMNRMKEFKSAMNCILENLEGKKVEVSDDEGVKVFKLNEAFNWNQIHRRMLRECRRVENGLPVYSDRSEILRRIHNQQVMVLIGETGSGKSTQLVQFLADSELLGSKSIVCTQPRKIAAKSLADRVRDESNGCYNDNDSITWYPSFSSAQQFKSKVIYMTDHCLLQHYMNDKNLSDISCILIDEAHERSLNTDLLLALLKSLLMSRLDLHLIIMSATADTGRLSKYFFGCGIFRVFGRNFPVDIIYAPSCIESSSASNIVAPYVFDVMRKAHEIHKNEKEGEILAFLTSQMEVEWAFENFKADGAVPLALHGKLSFDEQSQVFRNDPYNRKVIFATNIAETSLTIPGVKYVIDSGMIKDSKFEPRSGMNVLKVCQTSQSSANQRAGRAGRTGPGKCYRLYTQSEFDLMSPNQEPEIRRVHLGVAILRIFALGVKCVEEFDFVDAPQPEAIEMAIRNLVQLGAVRLNGKFYELTEEGRHLVKLGIEPRLGKLILSCFNNRVGREGVVLAVVMANSSSVFCRVGNIEEKLKSDRRKVQFCHPDGDLFTLLSVYKQFEALPREKRNDWCWNNSINAKTMRRCQEAVLEMEHCLKQELHIIIPSYWLWSPQKVTNHDRNLKRSILASLAENVAMFTGYSRLGYEVAMTGQHVQLHPSCSLLMFGEKPNWVVFSEILSLTHEYLVCVTAFDFDSLSTLSPSPLFNVSDLERRRLEKRVLNGFGRTLLKKFCGIRNRKLVSLSSRIQKVLGGELISIEVNFNENEVVLFSRSENMDQVCSSVRNALEYERKLLWNECMEKCLYHGSSPPVALFGAGAEIKHLELEKRYLTVDLSLSNEAVIDDKDLFIFLEKTVCGTICASKDSDDRERGYKITFLTPDAAEKAVGLDGSSLNGSLMKVSPRLGGDKKLFSFPDVKATVCWPRRLSKGTAILKCCIQDMGTVLNDLSNIMIGGRLIRCQPSIISDDGVFISGLNKELCKEDIWNELRMATDRKILDFFLHWEHPVDNPPDACKEALRREISPFMPKSNPQVDCFHVEVSKPKPSDTFMMASVSFDRRLHLEAAKALEHLEGKVLSVCSPWQKIKCQPLFHCTLSCSSPIYEVIQNQLNTLLASFRETDGGECTLSKNCNDLWLVKLSAKATKVIAERRQQVEELMTGKLIDRPTLPLSLLQHLTTPEGKDIIASVQEEAGIYIQLKPQSLSLRVFGPPEKIGEQKLVRSLHAFQIHLRGESLPPNLLKQVVEKFGPDLNGLKEKFPSAKFTLSTRTHAISVQGSNDLKQEVEAIIHEKLADKGADACPICLCDIEDRFELEGCRHHFCSQCLVEQFKSVIRNQGSFPVCCANPTCGSPILLPDMKFLLSEDKLEDLFKASLGSFVASSSGAYRFCPFPDCRSVYAVADEPERFECGACYTETCKRCHSEYHPSVSCEQYQAFKDDPDSSLHEWRKDKEHVKNCPVCGYTIEKVDGCNHIECRCGRHICWVCQEVFGSSDDCYGHLRSIHMAIV